MGLAKKLFDTVALRCYNSFVREQGHIFVRSAASARKGPSCQHRHAPAFLTVSLLRSLLLTALLCLAALALGPAPAHAGSYKLTISGGQFVGNDGLTHDDYDDGQGNYSAFDPDAPWASVYAASGALTVTGTWVPDSGKALATDPPPQCLLVNEWGYAHWEANGHDQDGGTCDDGVGDDAVPWDGDIACVNSGSAQLGHDYEHLHVSAGGPTFTWTRNPSITPGSDGGVCGDLLYSISLQGFNFPPYVMLPDGTTLRLIALGSPDAGLLGTPGVASAVPYDPSDPFGPDGEGDPAGPLGMTSAHPGTMPGTPQNAVVGGMVEGVQTTAVNVGVVLVTMGGGAVLEGVVDLGAVADGAAEGGGGGGSGGGGGGGDIGGGGDTGGGSNCFVAGTLVQMADGTTLPIETVKVGDTVWSRDPVTGRTEAKEILATKVHQSDELVALNLVDAQTDQPCGSIVCTPGHPFYVSGRGFVPAGMLPVGTSIVTRAGPPLVVTSVSRRQASAPVYNFTVQDDHTYFVGVGNGGAWVHNDCTPDTWGNPSTLDGHFGDHGSAFGATSPEDYANQASQFLQESQANGYPTTIDGDGIIQTYDSSTNTFGAYNPDGTTRTFLVPEGVPGSYWNSVQQRGLPPIILGTPADPLEGFR